ncbi:hypothetical protein LCGC14_2420500 [marine sediment metagenome]|uniref:Uncharacterized protein n=1 Tax=marine sediment metagenome TaxID=412755 RepID=A0A0F9BPU2_9ZZZZ
MSDAIYEDSISVSAGRFTVRTNQGPGKMEGSRTISLLHKTLGSQTVVRFNGLTDADLRDLFRALGEYLHMMSMSQ